ncbi:MAG: alpha/beta fold hydrolase [Bacillota bacterium]|nr:alpha/beta fold hydrolase [Bacillota bacterium]
MELKTDLNYSAETTMMNVIRNMIPRFIFDGAQYSDIESVMQNVCDKDSWYSEWSKLGGDYEEIAKKAEDEESLTTAKEAYLLAAICYRLSHIIIYGKSKGKIESYKREIDNYTKAAKYFTGEFKRVEILCDKEKFPGYLWKPEGVDNPPCVVVLHGADSTKEEYHTYNELFINSGIAVLIIDGPGQGETMLFSHIYMDNNFERAPKAAVDFLIKSGEVDDTRIAVAGQCMGGYQALRAASSDDRFKACFAISPFYYLSSWTRNGIPIALRKMVEAIYNVHSEDELKELASSISLENILQGIKCPVLIMHGDRDIFVSEHDINKIINEIKSQKEIKVYNGGYHAVLNKIKLSRAEMADWMHKMLCNK